MTATAIETLNGRNRDFASHRHVSSLKMMPRPASVGRARHRRVAREPGSLGRRGRDRSRLRRRNRTGRDRGRAVAAATRDRCGRGAPLAGGPSMREAPVDARHEAWSATGCTPQKLKARPLNLLEGTGPSGWLRGQDLNLRPSGCEGDFTQPADGRRHSSFQSFPAVRRKRKSTEVHDRVRESPLVWTRSGQSLGRRTLTIGRRDATVNA